MAAGYDVDFVGSQHFGEGIPGFDYHSEAHAARSIREIAIGSRTKDLDYPDSRIYAWLERNPADFVLLHVGSDSSSPPRVADVKTMLDEIDRWEQDNYAEVRVLLARIIDQKPLNASIKASMMV
jgi:hypothetical protein